MSIQFIIACFLLLTTARRLPDKRRYYRLRCYPPRRIGSHHQGRRRNIYGYRNIGFRPHAHPRAMRSGYLDLRVPCATFRVFTQSYDCDRTQPYCSCRRTRRRTTNRTCGVFTEPGEAPSEYCTDPWRRKSALSRTQDETRHTKIWTNIPCFPCRPSTTQVEGQSLRHFLSFVVYHT